MRRSITFAPLAILLMMSSGFAEDIVVNWETKSSPACPAEVNRRQTINIIATSVNDLLHTYQIHTRTIPRITNDAATLTGQAEKAADSNCNRLRSAADTKAQEFLKKFVADPNLNPVPVNLKYPSVPLSQTVAAWIALRQSKESQDFLSALESLRQSNCPLPLPTVTQQVWQLYRQFEDGLDKPHVAQTQYQIAPDTDVQVTISEFYKGSETARYEFTCKPVSGVLSFSVGTLVSSIASRSYESRKVPSGTGTDTQLVVAGDSRVNPTAAALLNYRLLDFDPLGFSLSAGPAFRIGGEEGTSNFGFFSGVSVRLWNRLFLTPGVHIGEFADYPAGFRPGSTIPDDFGELNPVKRWTTRFGFAITFRTNDFSSARQTAASSKTVLGGFAPTPSAAPVTPVTPTPAAPETPPTPAGGAGPTPGAAPSGGN